MAKILLVEDDNTLREIYEARLTAEGYDIVAAQDGEEALTVAMKERPDLIISDVMMPKISGFDMLDIIRSTEETKDAKVIMMTALSQSEDKERADKLGADRYLVKSQVTLEDVARVAREVLTGEETPAAAAAAKPATKDPAKPAAVVAPPAPTPAPSVSSDTASAPAPAPDPATQAATATTATATSALGDDTAAAMPGSTPQPATKSAAEPATKDDDATKPTTDDTAATTTPSTPEPAATPDPAAAAAAAAISSAQPTSNDEVDESRAIADQIESFMETKSNVVGSPVTEPTKPESTTDEDTKEEEEKPSIDPTTKISGKKVIQPLGDPLASAAPKLQELVQKEEKKEQMAQIAQDIVAKKQAASQAKVKPLEPSGETKEGIAVTSVPATGQQPAPTTVGQPEVAAPAPVATPEPVEAKPAGPSAEEQAAMDLLKKAAEQKPAGNVAEQAAAALSGDADMNPALNGGDLVIGEDGALSLDDSSADSKPEPTAATTPAMPAPITPVATPEPAAPTPVAAPTAPEPTPAPAPATPPAPTPTPPVIPHQNGVSMDGVVPPPTAADAPTTPASEPAPATPAAPTAPPDPSDPHNIAL